MKTNKNELKSERLLFVTGERPKTPLSQSHLEKMMKNIDKNSRLIININRY